MKIDKIKKRAKPNSDLSHFNYPMIDLWPLLVLTSLVMKEQASILTKEMKTAATIAFTPKVMKPSYKPYTSDTCIMCQMHRHAFRENTGAIISTNLQTMKMTRLNVHQIVKHGKLMRHNFIGDHLVKVEALVEDVPCTWGLMGISTPTILLHCSSEQANVRKKKAGKNFIMNLAYLWSFGKGNNNISAYLWTSVST
jgi:hypothetical protein